MTVTWYNGFDVHSKCGAEGPLALRYHVGNVSTERNYRREIAESLA
jgi:hypothetical protein